MILLTGHAGSADIAADALALLRDNCLRCHGEEKRKGGLALDSREALLAGGDSGPAVVGRKAAESPLVRLLAEGADPHMPPKKQLTVEEIATISRWVEEGLPWSGEILKELPIREITKWAGLPKAYRPVGAMARSPDGTRLAVAIGDRIRLFDLAAKDPSAGAELLGHRDVVQSLAWSPDGGRLVSGGYRSVRVWEAGTGELRQELKSGWAGRITALHFTGDGRALAVADSVASIGARLHVLSTKDWRTMKSIPAHGDAIYGLALSGDGKLMASVSADKLARLWSTEDWSAKGALEGHTDYVLSAAFAPDGERIATGSADATVKVWNIATRKQVSTFNDSRSELAVTGLHWRRAPEAKKGKNDDWILSISEDGAPRLYTDLVVHDGAQRSTGARMKAWTKAAAGLTAMGWDESGGRLFAGDVSGGVTVWDKEGKLTRRIDEP